MRTPGHDEELAAGFFLSEGLVRGRDRISRGSMSGENIFVQAFTAGVN